MNQYLRSHQKQTLVILVNMQDKFTRYLQLSNRIIISFVVFVAGLLLLLLGLRLLFGLLDSMSWFVYLFTLFIVIFPPAIFIIIFSVAFSRIKHHPAATVRGISYVLSGLALLGWVALLFIDIYTFFATGSQQISHYQSYTVLYLAGSVALIFALAIIQALTTQKEKDWMEKRRERLGE